MRQVEWATKEVGDEVQAVNFLYFSSCILVEETSNVGVHEKAHEKVGNALPWVDGLCCDACGAMSNGLRQCTRESRVVDAAGDFGDRILAFLVALDAQDHRHRNSAAAAGTSPNSESDFYGNLVNNTDWEAPSTVNLGSPE